MLHLVKELDNLITQLIKKMPRVTKLTEDYGPDPGKDESESTTNEKRTAEDSKELPSRKGNAFFR